MDQKNRRRSAWTKIWRIIGVPVVSVLLSYGLVWFLTETSASILVGADNFDARALYYRTTAKESRGIQCDSVIIYDPFCESVVTDTRRKLAEELLFVSGFKPRIIVFDHILPHLSHTQSDTLLATAIRACLDSGIAVIVPESQTSLGAVQKNYFLDPQFSLQVISGNPFIPVESIGEWYSNKKSVNSWIPVAVDSLVNHRSYDPGFFKDKYLNFDSPKRIQYLYRNRFDSQADSLFRYFIQSRIVIFSAYSAGDDIHTLPFEIQGIAKTDEERVKKAVSGAELLWYAIRDVLCHQWDKQLPTGWILVISLLLTLVYNLIVVLCFARCRKLKGFLNKIVEFVLFIIFTIIILTILGRILMHFHWILPMAYPAISLVFCNIFHYDEV
ncbi:MAG: hypothetical protein K6A64_09300 [Bacteroidales bacterium]|nr:hypothetical protein [Bacteroidales bacterium]